MNQNTGLKIDFKKWITFYQLAKHELILPIIEWQLFYFISYHFWIIHLQIIQFNLNLLYRLSGPIHLLIYSFIIWSLLFEDLLRERFHLRDFSMDSVLIIYNQRLTFEMATSIWSNTAANSASINDLLTTLTDVY